MVFESKKVFILTLILLVIVSTLVDYILAGPYQYVSVLAPSAGIILVYHLNYKKSVTDITLSVYFITLFISRLLFIEESIFLTFILSSYKTFVMFLMVMVLEYLIVKVKNNGYSHMNTRDVINYILIGIFVTFIGATLTLVPIYYILDYSKKLFWYGNTWIGYMFGFFIFGASLHFSILNDKEYIQRRSFYISVVYLGVLFVVSYLLFSEILPGFSYHNYSYLFLVLYLISTIIFSARIVFFANYVIYISYSLFHYQYGATFDLTSELFSIILILLVLTGSTVITKTYILSIQRKERETNKVKSSMKDMLYETNKILKNIDNITGSSKTFSNNFLIRMFRLGCNVLDKHDMASLFIKHNGKVKYLDSVGYDIDYLNSFNIDIQDFDWSFKTPKLIEILPEIYSKKFTENKEYKNAYPQITQSVRFTIFFDNKAVAGMSFDITENNIQTFTQEDLPSFFELSSLINSYYNLVNIQSSNNEFRNDIVISLVRALGLYDSYTGKHSEEVAFLSLAIARRLNLDTARTNRIYWSAIVHDIGKIGINPDTINKNEVLTEAERKEMEQHTVFGYNILNSVEGLKEVAVRVKHHHERWDGTGYPDGLKEKEIPLCSQILSICDAVSAMSRDRIYSKAKELNQIIKELEKERGKQFSPLVTDAMIEYIKETKLIDYYNETK